MSKSGWGKKKAAKKQAAMRAEKRVITQAVRQDMHRQMNDSAPGTSPAALGIVKAASEEARHETCFECGYGGGRHARICSRG